MKIMSSLYSGCINTANQAAQYVITANAFNNLITKINAGLTASAAITATPIDIDEIKFSYEQLQNVMQV